MKKTVSEELKQLLVKNCFSVRVHREKITRKLQLNAPDGSTKEDGLIDDDESQNVTSSLSPVSNKPRIMNILNS